MGEWSSRRCVQALTFGEQEPGDASECTLKCICISCDICRTARLRHIA